MQQENGRPIRLFSTPGRAWAAVAVYTAVLYSTLGLVLQAYLWVFAQIGEEAVSNLLNGFFALSAVAFLLLVRPRRLGAYVTLALIAAGLVFSFSLLKIPSNRLHFLEYAPLTVLVFNALRFHCSDRFRYIWTLFWVSWIGVGDEALQTLVGRRFDTHDLVLNSVGAVFVLAIIGFVLGDGSVAQSRKAAEEGGRRQEAGDRKSAERTRISK